MHAHTLYNVSLRLVFILDFLHVAISVTYKQWYYNGQTPSHPHLI